MGTPVFLKPQLTERPWVRHFPPLALGFGSVTWVSKGCKHFRNKHILEFGHDYRSTKYLLLGSLETETLPPEPLPLEKSK